MRHLLRGGLAGLLSLVLALASLVILAPRAYAAEGINATLLLNGAETYEGTPVVNEGDELTLRVQYTNEVVPGSTVEFELGGNVTLTGVPSGNTAITSVTTDGNVVRVTFADPWPTGVNQGVFDLDFTVNPVDASGPDAVTWQIDGEEFSRDVIIRNEGDQFENVSNGQTKGVNPTNLDSFVSVSDGVVTLAPGIIGTPLTYTLQVSTTDALDDYSIADQLPTGLGLVAGSFSATLTTWDANGLNRSTSPFPFAPAVSGNAFTGTVDLPAASILSVQYQAAVPDETARLVLQQALQEALDARDGQPGNFEITLTNTATFDGDVNRSANVRLRGNVPASPGPNLGNAFGKNADWTIQNVNAAEDGTLGPPLDITYTLDADLGQWDSSTANFTLDRNVVIGDVLPDQAVWNTTDAAFITATGMTLTQATGAACTQAAFADDSFVGQYCVDGRTLLVNIGRSSGTTVSIQAKALITTVAGLPEVSTTIVDATAYQLRNTGSFHYRDGSPYNVNRDVTIVDLPDTSGGINDSSVFVKSGTAEDTTIQPGETVQMDYSLVVSAGRGIDARESRIVDYLDTEIFDLADPTAVAITGDYDGQALSALHFALSTDADGNLVIELSAAGRAIVDARGADRRWQVDISLTTRPFVGKETRSISNRATLFGEDDEPLYWSQTQTEATSYGDEAEVRKTVFDRGTQEWGSTVDAQLNSAGELVQDTFVYRVDFIPRGNYDAVVIANVNDVLPDAAEFLGFVAEEDVATAAEPVPGPLDIGGNIEAAYVDGVVTLSQRDGTVLDASEPITVYFAVRITNAEAPIVNRIGDVEAVIELNDPPSIDIEKWTVEGEGSGPSYDDAGALTNDGYAGDFDAAPGKTLAAGEPQQVSFTISNDGGEVLTDVVVNDELTSGGGAIEDLACAFPDGSTGTTWAGPFQPGARFQCTGTLPALADGVTHADLSSVEGVGAVSGGRVTDEDPWYAHTGPPATEQPTEEDSAEEDPAEDEADELAYTGANAVLWWLATGALLVVVGGVGMLRLRRTQA